MTWPEKLKQIRERAIAAKNNDGCYCSSNEGITCPTHEAMLDQGPGDILFLLTRITQLEGALRDVIKYYVGTGRYNFSKEPEDQRDNIAFDAWLELADRINALLEGKDAE